MIPQFHHTDFLPLQTLYSRKIESGLAISLVIPALNECATIAPIIEILRRQLVETLPLLDEIVVIDSGSTDCTASISKDAGAIVHKAADIRPDIPLPSGKGSALWKSLFVTRGDICICIDADIMDFDCRFAYGLLGPLLTNDKLSFVKAYYTRPLIINSSRFEQHGGRVTEILVRPLLSAFFPELARFFQPLSGEYAFRRSLIKGVAFSSGYGVEVGLLLNIYKQYGLAPFAQVDMETRHHRNRPVSELGSMSFGILTTMLRFMRQYGIVDFAACPAQKHLSLENGHWQEKYIDEAEIPPVCEV